MNRLVNMFIRVVMVEIVRRGTSFGIKQFSQRKRKIDDPDQQDQVARGQGQINKQDMRKRMRISRGRF